ncbi:ribulose-phosphate 3-epimerase [uncultured Rikenella sp.]|uniref:ribulose-phosphate 3-epimerase n=1 Tax=uncultured Rikenella sp. TaxID=368003 RepID=UPI00261E7FCC|nr:ribulose-phosphate 3-epimerase [uncultured Rikenella sp.]
MPRIISPSFLSADFLRLGEAAETVNRSRAEWFHLDVMDGMFVPNISFGLPVVKALRKATDKTLDVHLMIVQPERYVADFREAGADYLTVHVEASTHLHRTLQAIRDAGMRAGVALNPHTPVCAVEEVAEMADMILIMSVNPGFGGQRFIASALDKIGRMKDLLLRKNSTALIQVDGGVNAENAAQLFAAGADVLVAGNAVFGAEDPVAAIQQLIEA